MSTLFPCVQAGTVSEGIINLQGEVDKLTVNELLEAVARWPVGTAKDPDGIRNEILEMAVQWHPQIFLDTMNRCLVEGTFPERWKIADLVLIPKPGRPLEDPVVYRPLCMLDTMEKLLEKTIVKRLRNHMESTGGLMDNKYGFRSGRLTTNSLLKIKDKMATANARAVKKAFMRCFTRLNFGSGFVEYFVQWFTSLGNALYRTTVGIF